MNFSQTLSAGWVSESVGRSLCGDVIDDGASGYTAQQNGRVLVADGNARHADLVRRYFQPHYYVFYEF